LRLQRKQTKQKTLTSNATPSENSPDALTCNRGTRSEGDQIQI
jgi:hypothetical protein